MLSYKKFNYNRKIILTDIEKTMKKINQLSTMGNFQNTDASHEVLNSIHEYLELAKRNLKYNDLLWEKNYNDI